MASPFPGMDPYLEGELWQEFHERLANQISNQLPVVPVPLLPPDEDVPLDLPAALTACYETVGYQRLLNYSDPPPPPPFFPDEMAWIERSLHSA